MGSLAASAVTQNGYWREGHRSNLAVKDLTLTLTGHGGTTNTIPASVLGFSSIRDVRSAVTSTGKILHAAPSYDRSAVVLQALPQTQKDYVVAGVNGAGNITATGLATTDEIVSVIDLTTPGAKTLSHYSIGSANTVAQAAGAGDTSAKSLLIRTNSSATGTPTDYTGTVRLIVVGKN